MAASALARQTPTARIEAARRILDSYVDDQAISDLGTVDFVNQLKDGKYLLVAARAIATARGAKTSMGLVDPGGMGSHQRNLEMYADVCMEHLGLPDREVIAYTDMENLSKVAAGLTALRDAVPNAPEEATGGLFPAPHSPLAIPSRMRRAMSDSEGTPRVSSPLRSSSASGWASSPAKFVGAVSASVANMMKSPRSSVVQEQTALRARLASSEDRIATISKRCERLREACTESEAQARNLLQEKSDLETTLATMQASMQQLREETTSARADASASHDELAKMEARAAEVQRKVDELQERINDAEDEAMKSRVEASKQEKLAAQARAEADTEAGRREELEREVASRTAQMQILEETLQSQAEQQKLAQDAAATSLAEVTARARTRSERAKALVRQCGSAHSAIRTAAEGMKSLSAEVRAQVGAASSDLTRMGKQLVEAAARLQTGAAEANRRYMRETKERRRAFNLLQEVRGNIRVFARVRPVLPKEAKRGLEPVVDATSDFELAVGGGDDSAAGTDRGPRSFAFDRVFGAESSQTGVYEEIAPVVMSAMDGFHVCIFAYGQTGSGKTHTMQGCDGHRGVYHRALAQIFEEAASRRDSSDYAISVSMVEIYNETVRDLLAGADSASSSSSSSSSAAGNTLDIKQGESGVYMPGVTVEPVSDAGGIRSLMARGEKSRSVGRTDANEHSSRSHSLLLIDVMGTSRVNGSRTSGRLVLVDLAGSERVSKSGAQGQRMKEAQAINKSLSALGDVIGALTHKTAHVPYRNSKLTYLLQDSLGGDNKALMIVQVSPVAESRSETVCSLNFAARVRKVERGAAKAHSDSGELNKLKAALKEARDQSRGLQGALEGAKRDLKELKQRSSKAEEKAKAVEATADRADAAKAAVLKSQRDAKKEAETLKVQLFEAKKAAAAEKARADKAAADLAKAKEEAKAATKEANSRVSTATRRAKEQAEAGATAAVSRAVSKEKAARAKAVADAAREAKAKARTEATAALVAKVKAAEDALQKERSRRRALEARVRRGSATSESAASRDGSSSGSVRSASRGSDAGAHAPVPPATGASANAAGARARGHAATPARRRSASVTGSSGVTGSAARSVASSAGRSAGHGGTTALLGSRRRGSASQTDSSQLSAGCDGDDDDVDGDGDGDGDQGLGHLSDAESDSSDVVSFNVGPAARKRSAARRQSAVSHASEAGADVPGPSVAAEEPAPSAEGAPEWPESPVAGAFAPDADSSAVEDAAGSVPAFALNDTFELRKSRGSKGLRGEPSDADGEADDEDADAEDEDEDVIDGFALSDAILQDLEDDEAEEGAPEDVAAGEVAAAGVSTPGASKRPAKRTRLGTPAAPSARHAARSGASAVTSAKGVAAALAAEAAAAAMDDSDAEEDEFRAASEVFGAAGDDADSTRLRFAPQEELNVGTPEQLSQAPQYAVRHALGKSPAVRGILKAKAARRNDPPQAKRPRRAITELSASAAAPAATSSSTDSMPAPARRARPTAAAPAPASAAAPAPAPSSSTAGQSRHDAGFGSKSTPALLGSILRSSSRASVILGQSSRSNAQRPLGGSRKRLVTAGSSGTGAPAGRTSGSDTASGRTVRQSRSGTSRATRVASSDGSSRGRWK